MTDTESKSKSASPQLAQPIQQTKQTDGQQVNNPIARKLNKILESRIENDKVRAIFIYER
jgi:hypothetical protein